MAPPWRLGQLDAVIFDHGICEKLLAHFLDLGFGLGGIGAIQFEFDEFALTDVIDAIKPRP